VRVMMMTGMLLFLLVLILGTFGEEVK